MKTINEVIENYSKYEVNLDDRFGIRFCSFLNDKQIKEIGFNIKDEFIEEHNNSLKEWNEENVIKQMTDDLLFLNEKSLNHKGISTELMFDVVKSWLKVLEDDLCEIKDYNDYARSFINKVAAKYNIDLKGVE